MKTILLLFLFSLSIFANEELKKSEQLKKALMYEQNSQFKEALYWYKQANFTQENDDNFKYQENYYSIFEELDDVESKKTIFQILGSDFGLYPYKKNYLLPYTYDFKEKSDRKKEETIFQLSVKIPLTYNLLSSNELIAIGYTQKSWWQTFSSSKPFRETNHTPEIFMMIPTPNISNLHAFKISLFHQSNGRSIQNSRSWNGLEISSFFQTGYLFSALSLTHRFNEKGSDPLNPNDDDNPQLMKYRGSVALDINYLYKRHIFSSKFLISEKEEYGSKTFEWSFPLTAIFSSNKTYGMFTYFDGYSESLIDYDNKVKRIGFGLQLSR